MSRSAYTESFYERHRDGARSSAEIVAPLLCRLLEPRSVIDVGCGVGTWLAAFRGLGVDDTWGVDGDWVDPALLEIPPERFRAVDLTRPLKMERDFDLVLSLEVAEHLPPECADTFVDSLTSLGPAICFSAAIPFQGGKNHVNEQWPPYWVERFAARGYEFIDCVRPQIWNHPKVEPYYAQNMLLYVRPEELRRRPAVAEAREHSGGLALSVVHPRLWESTVRWSRALTDAINDVAITVPPQALVIIVDDAVCGAGLAAGRPALPFLERNGVYWGPPPDDVVAIEELDRLREAGAAFLVVAWPAFWWLEHYAGFHRYLRSSFRAMCENDRTVIFDLRAL